MDLIDKHNLAEKKFVGVEDMQIRVSRGNCKTIIHRAVLNAYKIGWNSAIEAIIENEPVVEKRPQGKWKITRLQNNFDDVYCPFCNARPTRSEYGYYLLDRFCHDCGARLEGYAGDEKK